MASVIDIPESNLPKEIKGHIGVNHSESTKSINKLLQFMADARKEHGEDTRFVVPEGMGPITFYVDPSKLTSKTLNLRNLDMSERQAEERIILFEFAPGSGRETKVDLSGANLQETDVGVSGGTYSFTNANLQSASVGRVFNWTGPSSHLDFSSAKVANLTMDFQELKQQEYPWISSRVGSSQL